MQGSVNFNDWLGLEPGEGEAEVVLDSRPEHAIAPGTLHFAVVATLAEVSAASAVAAPVVPTTLQINLMRRAAPGRLVGRGRLLKRGRTLAVAEGEVFQEDKIVAKATVTFAVMSG